ncbi:MAG: hypothetical protein JJ975_05765 [Bacteroidia bacterium]|nr:hypothetical protein [Bacteroidia bacterium]
MRTKTIIPFLVVLTFISCNREKKRWDTNILTPLFTAELGFSDMVDDSLLITNSDNSYRLSYDYEYAIDSVSSYLEVPDTLDKIKITLDKLVLADRTYTDTFTLRQMDPTIGLLDGLTMPLDAQKIDNPQGEQEIDVSEEFFRTAKFIKGFLDITVHNDLPVYVDQIIFKLANKNDGSIVAQDTFRDIAPNSSAYKEIDLAGKQVNGVMIGSIISVETRASDGPVLIDADKGVRLELGVRDLEPEFATAVFPEQTLVEDKQEVIYKFGGPMITEIKALSGKVIMKIASTIEEEIIIDYSFPNSGENGDFTKPFKRSWRVPPAKPGETQIIEGEFNLDGYAMQYKGQDPNTEPFFNAVYSELVARTVYSGEVRDLSLEDFVEIEFGLVDIVPEYAFGDFGYKEYNVNETFDIPIFRDVSGDVSLEDITMDLWLENAFGIQALTTLNSITAANSNNKKQVSLTHPDLIGQDILLRRATNPPLTPSLQRYTFDKTTSNIKAFTEVLPDEITSDIKIISRPNGSRDLTDFVKNESYLKARLSVQMPVQFAADNLTLVQKQHFDFNGFENSERIKSGTFKLKVENDYPFDMEVLLEFLTETDEVITTLFADGQKVESPSVDGTTGRTIESELSWLTADVSETQMDMVRDASKIRIRAVFDTPNGSPNKIFSNYKLKTKLIADFVYEQNL